MITVRQPSFTLVPALADGFTHASSVIPLDSASDALWAMLTIDEEPLNWSAPPKPVWPVTRVAAAIAPLLLLPDPSTAVVPEASLNDSARTGPAAGGGGVAGPSETPKATPLPAGGPGPPGGLLVSDHPAGTA